MLRKAFWWIKTTILPGGRTYRRLRFGPARGCVMKIDLHCQLSLYFGRYEKELIPHFRSLLRANYNSFDLGGHNGYDALMLAKGSGGRVVSFEPRAHRVVDLRETFALNGLPIETVQAWVGAHDDDQHITVDTAAANYFVPDFIKMDIEGAEVSALKGAARVLSTRKPGLIIETHSAEGEAECVEILRSHGYEPQVVNQRTHFKEHRQVAHNRWLVCPGRV